MLPLAAPRRALVRSLSSSYAACIRARPELVIDVEKAKEQHARYVLALTKAGVEVTTLDADDACPDGCFIEDTAVIAGESALLTRPGAAARRAELPKVAEALAKEGRVHVMEPPATLDGGDVLRVGNTLFVGLSTRTNRGGAEQLRGLGLDVVTLQLRGGLHLKSACTIASERLLVYDGKVLGEAELRAFDEVALTLVHAYEPAGANVLALGDTCLVSAAAPRTAEALAARGVRVQMIDVSEFHKGDGALTCLSLRFPRSGAWCV